MSLGPFVLTYRLYLLYGKFIRKYDRDKWTELICQILYEVDDNDHNDDADADDNRNWRGEIRTGRKYLKGLCQVF